MWFLATASRTPPRPPPVLPLRPAVQRSSRGGWPCPGLRASALSGPRVCSRHRVLLLLGSRPVSGEPRGPVLPPMQQQQSPPRSFCLLLNLWGNAEQQHWAAFSCPRLQGDICALLTPFGHFTSPPAPILLHCCSLTRLASPVDCGLMGVGSSDCLSLCKAHSGHSSGFD